MAASDAPFSAAGVDFSNQTQASSFLENLLDDSVFQVDANATARNFWYGIAATIGVAAIYNLIWRLSLRARLQTNADRHDRATSSGPSAWAKLVTLVRRMIYPQFTPVARSFWVRIPPLGTLYVIIAYLVFIVALEFAQIDAPAIQYWSFLGIRAGWLAVAQLPLIILLAGKNNLIGLLSGVSYERLNVYHRWVARGLLLLATFHFAFLSTSWNNWGLTKLEWATDTAPPTGIAAYAILLWINFSTVAPLRHLSYEFFVVQHVMTFFGLIIAIAMHLPGSAAYSRVYIYIPSALFLAEKIVHIFRFALNNVRPGRATLEAFDGAMTRVRVSNRQFKNWAPGTHVLLAIPRFGLIQSHPATIMSTPSSHGGDMIFMLRAHRGFTKRISEAANIFSSDRAVASMHREAELEKEAGPSRPKFLAFISGPYGHSHADFACFDSVLLISGGSGITWTTAILLDLAQKARSVQEDPARGRGGMPLRVVRFVWIIKKRSWLTWISAELQSAGEELIRAGIDCSAQIYVTQSEPGTQYLVESSEEKHACHATCSCGKTTGTNTAVETLSLNSETTARNATALPGGAEGSSENVAVGFNAHVHSGRPALDALCRDVVAEAQAECAVGVCGPLGLAADLRKIVPATSNSKTQGVYLHVENF